MPAPNKNNDLRDKKKISLFINSLSRPGGAERVFTDLANNLYDVGYNVVIVKIHNPEPSFYDIDNRINVLNLNASQNLPFYLKPFKAVGRSFNRIRRIRETLKRGQPDLVISFKTEVNVEVLLANFGRLPVIVSERNDPDRPDRAWYWSFIQKWLYNKADFITSNSKSVLEKLGEFVTNDKLVHTPNPVSRPVDSGVNIDNEGTRYNFILTVGRLHPQKGYDLLFRAFSQIRSDLEGWKLRVVGEGDHEKELKTLAKKLEINDVIEWMGTHSDLTGLYLESKIFVLPSRWEGVPNAMLEAMSHRLPVLASNVEGILEYIAPDKSGLIFEVEDVEGLSEGLKRLVQDKNLRLLLAQGGYDVVKEMFDRKPIESWLSAINRLFVDQI